MVRIGVLLICLLLVSAACSDNSEVGGATTTRDEPRLYGHELFEARVIGPNPGCVTCHSRDPDVTLVGPSLANVASRVDGMSDAEYVRESILEPDVYVVKGFAAGVMSPIWDEYLTDDQIESLVTFLLDDQ